MRVAGRVVTPSGVVDGYVEVAGTHIIDVGLSTRTNQTEIGVDRPTSIANEATPWIVPGFVDIHVHGGGGHTFTAGDPDSARAAAEFHLRHGTTTLLAGLVSSPYELMRKATEAYGALVADGVVAGIYYEGPYLSTVRCGAQNPAYLRDASVDELAALVELGQRTLRMVTVAPERPGALDAIRYLRDSGVVAALGHTDASYEQTLAGIAAGATVGTHVFNAMRPPHHREPGPVFALLSAEQVVCELVADGVHLHDGTLAFAAGVTGPGRAALITDGVAAAGMPDGEYELGGQAIVVVDRTARLASNGAIAGSTLTMDAALRQAVGAGLSVVDAAAMAATTPARAIGLAAEVGSLAPGRRADLVVLDPDLRVRRVMRGGTWVT